MSRKRRLLHLIPLVLSLAVWLPLIFLAGGSLMSGAEAGAHLGPVLAGGEGFATWRLLPRYPTLAGYLELLLDSPGFFALFWNSAGLAAGVLLGQGAVATLAAWWFARTDTGLSRGLFALYLILMLMPFQVTSVSSYRVLELTGLLNTPWAVLLPAVFSTFPVLIIYGFFRGIPPAVVEAAQIDGAGRWQIFLHIGLPLGRPGIASALVLGFLECWNMIEQPLTFLQDKSLWPLSLYLPSITPTGAGTALAASVVAMLPPVLVFLYGQSDLEQGLTGGGVKE